MKKTKVQVPLVPLMGKQNILEMRVPQKVARLSGEAHKMSGMEEGRELESKLCNWGEQVSTTKHTS